MQKIFTALVLLTTCVATPVAAYDAQFVGRITMIEPTYVPSHIVFKSDNGAGSCTAGALLPWPARGNTADEKIANIPAIQGHAPDCESHRAQRRDLCEIQQLHC